MLPDAFGCAVANRFGNLLDDDADPLDLLREAEKVKERKKKKKDEEEEKRAKLKKAGQKESQKERRLPRSALAPDPVPVPVPGRLTRSSPLARGHFEMRHSGAGLGASIDINVLSHLYDPLQLKFNS